jgi:DNA repair exonuclease SbcCD nuclease subunit
MKIAIVSDIHLGYDRFAEDAYKQANEAFEMAGEVADAILVPGDVFDKRYPKPEIIAQAINIFRELSKKDWGASVSEFIGNGKIFTNVPIIAIPGTHERIAEGRDNALRLLSLAGLLVDTSEATTVLQKGKEKVAVFGLGGLSEEMAKGKIAELAPKPVEGAFNIFMFHQSVYEILPFSDSFMHYSDLPKGFDLYVCGHIHSSIKVIVNGKPFLIPGSTVITQLKDQEQEKKGFILFDTQDSSYNFIQINSRPFISKKLHFEGAAPKEIIEKTEDEIKSIISNENCKPIIKIKIEGSLSPGFSNSDIRMRTIESSYSKDAFLSIDMSQLVDQESEARIEEVREGKVGSLPIKELGMLTFLSKLEKAGVNKSIDYDKLFNILSGHESKEKVIKSSIELLFKGES